MLASMNSEEGHSEDRRAASTIADNIKELQDLVDQVNAAVDRQQQKANTAPQTDLTKATSQDIYEMSQLMLLQRRQIDELQRHFNARESEHTHSVALQEVAATINSSLELDQVLNQVMDVIITLTNAERAMLLLIDEESGRLEVQVARNMDRESIERSESFQISRSIVRRVAEDGDPVATTNAQEDERFSTQESIVSYGLRSILCVPLKIKDEITGVIYADNRIASGIFGEKDRDLLAAFANQAAVAIENARLFREIRNNLAEITEMKELMDNVFASVDSGVITIDEEDRIALYNRAAAKILGVPAEFVLDHKYEAALHTVGLPVQQMVNDVKASGQTRARKLTLTLIKNPVDHA